MIGKLRKDILFLLTEKSIYMNVNEEPDVSHAWGMSGVNGFPGSYIKHVLRILLVYPDSTDSRTLLLNSKIFCCW